MGMNLVVGSIHGLVCLCNPPLGLDLILWNPAMRRYKEIPLPDREIESPPNADIVNQVSLGFAYDSVSVDYKVIRIVSYKLTQELFVFVYSADAESWKEIRVIFPYLVGLRCNAIAKGIPYREAVRNGEADSVLVLVLVLVSFDVRNEVFREWPLPEFASNIGTSKLLVNLNESLALMVHSPGAEPNNLVEVYTLDDKSGVWSKIHTIGSIPVQVKRMISYFRNGEIAIEDNDGKLLAYNAKTNVIKSVPNDAAKPHSFDAFNYVETLITIKGMKQVGKEVAEEVTPSIKKRNEFLSNAFTVRL